MINGAVAWHTFHQHHWIRISLLGLVLLWVFLSAEGVDRIPLIGVTPFLVWLLGSGIIGRDMSSGVAHLLFTRPITRRDYIFTKWASLVAAVAGFQCLILLVWIFGKYIYPATPHIAFPIAPHSIGELLKELVFSIWITAVVSTVLILFSTIMTGWGDLALLLYVHVLVLVLSISPLKDNVSGFEVVIDWMLRIIWPGAKIGYQYVEGFNHSIFIPSVGDFVVDTLIAGLYLFFAVKLISRKDMGYTNL